MVAQGQIVDRSTRDRLLPGPHPAARRCRWTIASPRRSVRPGAVGDELQDEDRRPAGQRHPVWPGVARCLDARRQSPAVHGEARQERYQVINNYGAGGGVMLPGGVKSSGVRPREGLRGAVWLYHREDGGDQTRITTGAVNMRVKDKSIIVTGSGGGIGEASPNAWPSKGQVIVNDINTALGEKVVADITTAGGTASFFAADVTKKRRRQSALVDAAGAAAGKLDVMVNNAGWTHRNRPALEVSEDEFDKCYAVNMKSIYLATIHAACFRAGKGGSFINIASTAVRPRRA